jgi:putative transcriptional regulator
MKVRILLQDRLDERGLSQRKLHQRTGIRLQTINEYCRELTDRINIEHLALICTALNCCVSDILALYDEKAGAYIEFPMIDSDVDAFSVLQKIAFQIRPVLKEYTTDRVLIHK